MPTAGSTWWRQSLRRKMSRMCPLATAPSVIGAPGDSRFRRRGSTSSRMDVPTLDPDDYRIVAELLRQAIDGEKYRLSPTIRRWRAILAKIEPPPAAEPLPPLKLAGEPSQLALKMRGGSRRR